MSQRVGIVRPFAELAGQGHIEPPIERQALDIHDLRAELAPLTPAAIKAAGSQTIAAGLTADTKFMAAAKSAGLDKTLAGPGPYTVFVPDDAAFAKLPAGTLDSLGVEGRRRSRSKYGAKRPKAGAADAGAKAKGGDKK